MGKYSLCWSLLCMVTLGLFLCIIPGCCLNDCGLRCKPCKKVWYRKLRREQNTQKVMQDAW